MIIIGRKFEPIFEVALERSHGGRMEWNEAALTEFGFANLQHSIGQNVLNSEVERLGNTEPCRRYQPKQGFID